MRLRRFTLISSVLVVAILASLGFLHPAMAQVDAPGQDVGTFTTTLLGGNEVPGPGDPDGSGFAAITLIGFQSKVCFGLSARGIEPATAAHIHVGAAGVAGDVVVTLKPPTPGGSGGCVVAAPEVIEAILANPENYYVNVHNAAFPDGALRGQLG